MADNMRKTFHVNNYEYYIIEHYYYHSFTEYFQKHISKSCFEADHYKMQIQLIGKELNTIIPQYCRN